MLFVGVSLEVFFIELVAPVAHARVPRSSADFQSAVSRISNPPATPMFERAESLNIPPIGNRR